uniref:Ig-like domain-containing protein n=1 Tax=Neogobius melanostomus TaxID=47308 RepID=A0A8C6TLB3_9GOBI
MNHLGLRFSFMHTLNCLVYELCSTNKLALPCLDVFPGQTLMVPSQPLVVPVGSEVTLPCQLESVKNIKDLVVEWGRHDLKPRYVHIRRDGLDLLIDQNSLYLGRTRLLERGLAYGDMSLTLSRVRLSDAGTYHCFIPQMDPLCNERGSLCD